MKNSPSLTATSMAQAAGGCGDPMVIPPKLSGIRGVSMAGGAGPPDGSITAMPAMAPVSGMAVPAGVTGTGEAHAGPIRRAADAALSGGPIVVPLIARARVSPLSTIQQRIVP